MNPLMIYFPNKRETLQGRRQEFHSVGSQLKCPILMVFFLPQIPLVLYIPSEKSVGSQEPTEPTLTPTLYPKINKHAGTFIQQSRVQTVVELHKVEGEIQYKFICTEINLLKTYFYILWEGLSMICQKSGIFRVWAYFSRSNIYQGNNPLFQKFFNTFYFIAW